MIVKSDSSYTANGKFDQSENFQIDYNCNWCYSIGILPVCKIYHKFVIHCGVSRLTYSLKLRYTAIMKVEIGLKKGDSLFYHKKTK